MNGNLFELLRSRFAGARSEPFLSVPGGSTTTYGEIDELSAGFAAALKVRGVNPGDRVVVQIDKSVDSVALYLACLRAGAVYVPLNTAYVTSEVQFFVDDARPALFVHGDDRDDLSSINALNTNSISELGAEARTDQADSTVAIRLADDLAAMLYTSGTTGRSKGAMLTHANLASNALTLHSIWRFEPGDVLLHILPIFHVHGLFVALHTAMLNSSEVLFVEKFSVAETLDLLPTATVMMGVPTHYSRLLADSRFDDETCRNVRLFTCGSAPMTEAVHTAVVERTGHRVLERYGMTETGMLTSNPYEGERVAGTVGFTLPGVQLRVCDPDGNECAPGVTGVVEVSGPNLFAGYWQLPQRTEAEHRDDGFFITGDIGFLDEEGRLTLEGRSSDMIISGGLNVYPREIEMQIDALDGVVESAVIGVPDDDLGEAVVAVVVAEQVVDGAVPRLTAQVVDDALRGTVAPFKVPKTVTFVDALPRNAMGKVQKAELRAEWGL